MTSQETKKLAEKIARVLDGEPPASDLAALYASIEKISHRLDKIESGMTPQSSFSIPQSTHPSQEKFDVAEAIADEIFAGLQKEKACTFEPNAKPFYHCSMCSARGF